MICKEVLIAKTTELIFWMMTKLNCYGILFI